MSLSLGESQVITEMAEMLYDFLHCIRIQFRGLSRLRLSSANIE
jgi:hypothetical protein